jgi:hypothetical protein
MESGFLLWAFILIGNAGALIVLSAITAGGTSAMGSDAAPVRRDVLERPV